MVDVREPKVAEDALQQQPIQTPRQLPFVEALNSMAQISLANDDAQAILQDITDVAGKTLAVDHCLIYDIDFEQHRAIGLSEWRNPGCPNLRPTKAVYNLDLFISAYSHLQTSQGWLESHSDSINPCFLNDGSAALLHEEMHVQSLLWHPFYFHCEGYYLLLFNQVSHRRKWQQDELTFINAVASQVSIALQKIRLVRECQQAEEVLSRANQELELRIEQRTVELRNTVERLQTEIAISEASRRASQQSEQVLQSSEQRFRAVFEKTAIGMGLVDLTGELIASNPALHQIIGYTPEELRTMTLADYTHPDDVAADLGLYQELLAGKCDYYQLEKRFIKKNGELFWGRLTVSAIRGADGEIEFTFGTVEDINERKQAEKALQESEEQFRLIAEAIPLPVLITRVCDGKILYSNASLASTFGLSSTEFLDRTLTDFYYDPVADRPALLDTLQRDGYINHYELCVKKADGTPFWVLLSARFLKVNNESAMLTAFYDLTQRKQAEEALRESEARFRSFVENANDIIYSATPDGIFDYISPNWTDILGHDVSEVEGKPFSAFVHPEDVPVCVTRFNKLIQTGRKQAGIQYRVKHQDGSWRWHISNVSVTKDDEGKIVHIIGIARDISKYKQAEQAIRQSEARFRAQAQELEKTLQELRRTQSQLIQTEKMSSLGQLVAGVAHEINNPVTFIYGNLTPANEYIEDLLNLLRLYQQLYPQPRPEIKAEMEAIDLEFLVEDLPKIIRSMKMGANRIREIVLSLRNFSRLDEAEIKAVDIHEGLNNTLLILQSRLKATPERPEIQVIQEYGSLPKVECYAGQINQVFMNILNNAIDALEVETENSSIHHSQFTIHNIPPQRPIPTIRIRTEVGKTSAGDLSQVEQDWVTIRIADNGQGMKQAVMERLFDPFFTTKPVGQGTGLGLSISYQIVVKKHGGRLSCESALGQGSEFFIEIPIYPNRREDPSCSAAKLGEERQVNGGT